MTMIPLAVPDLTGNEARYLQECVASNFVSSVGPFVERFEQMLAAASGTRHAVATSSGTAALHLMMVAAGVARDDLVLMPSYTFIGSANAVSHAGATPAFIDIDPASWTMSPDALEEFLGSCCAEENGRVTHRGTGRRVAAILPVHAVGHPCDMDALSATAARRGLTVLWDAAAALGARCRGRAVTTFAAASALSFNGNKTVTCGGGGAIVTDDPDLARRAAHLGTTARVSADYDHDMVGFNYRMTNLQAAVGCAQLERLDVLLAAKRRIAARYAEAFAPVPFLAPLPHAPWAQSADWYSGVVLAKDAPVTPDALIAALGANGAAARRFWKPVHLQNPYRGAPRGAMTVSEGIWQRVVTLPCSTGLSDADQERVIETVLQACAAATTSTGWWSSDASVL